LLVPARRRGVEILDDPATDPALRARSIRDVARANLLLGGARAVLAELARLLPTLGASATLLDVGIGQADIPRKARVRAYASGVALHTFGLDEAESLVRAARDSLDGSIRGDARRLPVASASVDVVTCSQLLHHFADDEIPGVLRGFTVDELARHVLAATGQRAEVRRHLGFRLTATWRPRRA
jgi:SAM-dependent methyltransferase